MTSSLSSALATEVPLSLVFEAPRLRDYTARLEDLRR
jgi:hypothetical protein